MSIIIRPHEDRQISRRAIYDKFYAGYINSVLCFNKPQEAI